MKYLLDTHTFVWLDSASVNLSSKVHSIIADSNNMLLLSLTSIWEMQIKLQTGKLRLRASLPEIIKDQQQKNRIEILPTTLDHILYLSNLPDHHREPFDRMLIAQANIEQIPILSRDSQFAAYPVTVIW
jgi:PIN domain nuclease of toxin-antitoxin system